MKYFCYLFFLVPMLLSSCSSEITITEEQLPQEILYLEGHSVPFTGKCLINYSKSNQLHYSFRYKDGILNGPFQSFYKNGKLKDDGNYVDGELQGKFTRYTEDGGSSSTFILKTGELAKRN